jgi:hypothetical protein
MAPAMGSNVHGDKINSCTSGGECGRFLSDDFTTPQRGMLSMAKFTDGKLPTKG